MDDKKKFEIEFDDDFDAWLANREKTVTKPEIKNQTKDRPVSKKPPQRKREVAAGKPASAQDRPVKKKKTVVPEEGVRIAQAPVKKTKSVQPVKEEQELDLTATRIIGKHDVSSSEQPASSPKDVPISRRDTVKKFQLNIDESVLEEPKPEVNDNKSNDKAIYFAAHQPNKQQIEHRRMQEQARLAREQEESVKRAGQRKKQSNQVAHLSRLLNFVVILIVSVVCAVYVISCMNDVLALNRSDELVTVTVDKDDTYENILTKLKDHGLIKHKWFSKLVTTFREFDGKTYINGIYYLTADMGVEGMLTEMYQQQTSDETVRLSFPEGWTIQQIFEKLDKNDVCPSEYLYEALSEVEFEFDFVSSIPADDLKCFLLEGYFFPDTYDFFVSEKQNGMGENPNSVIRKFLENFESKWGEIYEKRAQELGMTMDEVIIIASIIQKEAADKSQMEDVSSVIHNRLNNPSSYPTLGCDSTKKYVTNYLVKALGDNVAGAYTIGYDTNSIRSGLPAGPICNPGLDAIEAALNPSDTDYYYFCHNNDGKIYLAETYSQFQSNWAQVLKDNEE